MFVVLLTVAVGAQTVGQVIIVEKFAAPFAPAVEVMEAVIANVNFAVAAAVNAVQIFFVMNFSAVLAALVGIEAAIVTNENGIAVSVVGVVHVVPMMNFAALGTFRAVIFNAVLANIGVIDKGHLVAGVILVAVATIAEVFFETIRANVNSFAVSVENTGNGVSAAAAFVAGLAAFRIAVIAVQSRRNFLAARNAQAVSSDGKSLEIVEVILVDGDFRAEIRNFPILVAAETVVRIDVNVPLVS